LNIKGRCYFFRVIWLSSFVFTAQSFRVFHRYAIDCGVSDLDFLLKFFLSVGVDSTPSPSTPTPTLTPPPTSTAAPRPDFAARYRERPDLQSPKICQRTIDIVDFISQGARLSSSFSARGPPALFVVVSHYRVSYPNSMF